MKSEGNNRGGTTMAAAVIEADCECCDVLPEKKRRKLQAAYESSQRKDSRSLIKLLPEIARAMEVISDDDTSSSDSDHDDYSDRHDHKPMVVKKILASVPQIKPLAAPSRLASLRDTRLSSNGKFPSLPAGKPLARPPRLFLKNHDKSAVALKEIDQTLL